MNIDQLVSRIQQADWTVLDERETLPDADIEPIARLAEHAHTQVRELALYVLDNLDDRIANRVFFERLRDANEMIRFRACELLSKRVKRLDLASIYEELKSNPDPDIRSRMAKLLGEREGETTLSQLTKRLNLEPEANVRHAIRLAMARLGEQAPYPAILEHFKTDEPRARLEALSDCEYVGSGNLAKHLLFLLNDTRDVLNVGLPHFPEYVRVCDVTVNTFDRLLGHPFKFALGGVPRRYTPDEIQQVRQVLGNL